MVSVIVLSHQSILDLNISGTQCLEWVEEAFKIKEASTLPPKISMKHGENGFINVMPVVIGAKRFYGVKIVSRYPNHMPSLDSELMLYDLNTGKILALMDANWITTFRTGAVATLAIKQLAKRDFATLAFIGLGNTARATLSVLLDVYPEREFTIKLKVYKDQELDFIKRFESHTNIKFQTCVTNEELIRGSDVIISCITYTDDLIGLKEWFDEGCLVVPVHTRGFQNCDLFFDKVVADDKGHVKDFKYFDQFKHFEELDEVILGSSTGRENQKQRILAYNIGIALHDIYFASQIYNLAGNTEGKLVHIDKPSRKFWV